MEITVAAVAVVVVNGWVMMVVAVELVSDGRFDVVARIVVLILYLIAVAAESRVSSSQKDRMKH